MVGSITIIVVGIAITADAVINEGAAKPSKKTSAGEVSPLSIATIVRWTALILALSILIPLLLEGGLSGVMQQLKDVTVEVTGTLFD